MGVSPLSIFMCVCVHACVCLSEPPACSVTTQQSKRYQPVPPQSISRRSVRSHHFCHRRLQQTILVHGGKNDIAPPSINNQLLRLPAPAWAHCLKIFFLTTFMLYMKTSCGPVNICRLEGDPSYTGHKRVEICSFEMLYNNSFNWNWTFVKVEFVLAARQLGSQQLVFSQAYLRLNWGSHLECNFESPQWEN